MSLSLSRLCEGIAPSATLKQNALVAQMHAAGMDIIGLGAGEPDFNTPAHIRDAATRAIAEGKTHYTAVDGVPALRQALCSFLLREKGLRYSVNETIICNGAKQALVNALMAILDPGDEVILPIPCWLSYPEMIRMAGGVTVTVPAGEDQGFLPDIAQIRAAVTRKTKAIILNTPCNPTGAVWPEKLLRELCALAVSEKFYIISDEIYEKMVYGGAVHVSPAQISPDAFKHTILISGLSKAYAMTGWRIGYAAGPRDVIAAMSAYQSHATGNANSIAQYAAIAALTGDQQCVADMVEEFARRRELILSCIRKLPLIGCAEPQGAFYVLLDVRPLIGREYRGTRITDDSAFTELLLCHAQVAAVPGTPFFAPGYVRLSYAIDSEKITEAMQRLSRFLEDLMLAA